MALRNSTRATLRFIRRSSLVVIGLVVAAQTVLGGGAFDRGTPAESRGGLSGLAAFSQDKIETVSLTNGNLNIHIPLVMIGGRGSASYTIALNHNSKLWSAHTEIELRDNGGIGNPISVRHNTATYDDLLGNTPNTWYIGSGWSILLGPAIKVKRVDVDPMQCSNVPEGTVFKYVVTKVWLVLGDGSEIELRDDQTDGAPYFKSNACANPGQPDRDRGRVWHSTDGKAITYVTDAANGVVNGQLSGYVFLSDGSRLRINGSSAGYAPCIRIIDPNANWVRINYNSPVSGAVTYTDQLGRDVILQSSGDNVLVTVKGYGTVADRIITVVKTLLFPDDDQTPAPNLRSDYDVGGANYMPRPFISGDYENTAQGTNEHALYGNSPHTDVITGSDLFGGYTPMSSVYGVTQLNLLDGRSFVFRYISLG